MLCFRVIFWGIVLLVLLIPGGVLVGIIGRIAGFRPGSKVGSAETAFGSIGIVVLSVACLGICLCAGLIDWAVATIVDRATPQPLVFNATPKPIPADWNEEKLESVWLSDMQEFNTRVGWGIFGKKGKLGYHVGGSDNIRVDNKFYPNSISMHPPRNGHSTVSYQIDRNMKLFKSWAAYSDREHGGWNPQTPATFVILGDGVCLWASNPVPPGAMEACRISVEGVDVMELQVHCPGGNSHVRAVWLEPQLFK